MSAPETTEHERPPDDPLRARMLDESVRVLGALPDGDALVQRVLNAADGPIDDLRNTIADGFNRGIDWMQNDHRECRKLRSHAGKRHVPADDRTDVVAEAFLNARELVDRFRRAEGRFSGTDPESATPAHSNFWGWMLWRVDAMVTQYWRDTGPYLGSDEVGGKSDPSAPTPEEIVVERAPVGDSRGIDVRRRLLRRAADRVSEDLASADFQARKAGADRAQHLRRVLAAVTRLLAHIEREQGLDDETLTTPDTIAELVDACTRHILLAEPEMDRDRTDKPMQRGLRSDVLFAAAGALRMALSVRLPDSLEARERRLIEDVIDHLRLLQIALQLAQIKPVVTLLGYRVTSEEVGKKRFAADLAWLDELLDWLERETSRAQRAEATLPALRWLEDVDPKSTCRESPIERARREIDQTGLKTDEALRLLEVHARLSIIVKGLDR